MIDVGDLHYNGWDFPQAIHAQMRAQPVLDRSGRHTKHVLYTLRVEMILYPGVDDYTATSLFEDAVTSADGDEDMAGNPVYNGMDGLRLALLEDGKDLIFTGKGFGHDFDIRTGRNEDVAHGPHVKELIWEPIGANKAVRVVWAVEVAIRNCRVPSSSSANVITEFSTDASYSIDEKGLTSRTIRGAIVIPNRLVGNIPQRWVDSMRKQINVPVPNAYQRIRQQWNVSSDGTTLEFSVTDRQYESQIPLHQGVIEQDVNHRVESLGSVLNSKYRVTVSGSFVVAPGSTKLFAWAAFLWFVKGRRQAALDAVFQEEGVEDGKNQNIALPLSLTIDDSVTSREMSFSISWLVYCRPTDLMEAAGMLTPVRGSSWSQHATSMQSTWRNGGHSQLTSQKRLVIRPCEASTDALYVHDSPSIPYGQDLSYLLFRSDCKEEWLRFDPTIEELTTHEQTVMNPTGGWVAYSNEPGPDYVDTSSRGITHTRAKPRFIIRLTLYGTKSGGEKIKKPKLLSYGGVEAKDMTPLGDGQLFTNTTKTLGDCDLHTIRWVQDFELHRTPKNTDFVTKPNYRIP